jgi:alcohol dehydrogenase
MIKPFSFASTPHIHFGIGSRSLLTRLLNNYGSKVLLVSGGRSFDELPLCQQLWAELQDNFEVYRVKVTGEPSPQLVDEAVALYHGLSPDCVVAIGGGSAVDAGKAIAGLLPSGDSVMDYLEGVGIGQTYHGPSTPFIAIPTTAGTGGETSKNGVLSVIGTNGFKKSFRDEQLVPAHVILDPELTVSCPAGITAACGMDAFTQLLESFVSCKANPMTHALCLSGLQGIRDGLIQAFRQGDDLAARSSMLYASSISGLTLANAGLGSVHGLASPLGAFFPIPHGVACATMLYEAVKLNIEAMVSRAPDHESLMLYAEAGRLMAAEGGLSDEAARTALLVLLKDWIEELRIPRLSEYGITEADIPQIIDNISGGSMSGNPVDLQRDEIEGLIRSRL